MVSAQPPQCIPSTLNVTVFISISCFLTRASRPEVWTLELAPRSSLFSTATVSASARVSAASQHISDIRSPGRVGEHRRPESLGAQFLPDRESKNVDHLVGVRPEEMRAEHAVGLLLDQRFEAVSRLRRLTGGEPVRRFLRFGAEPEPAFARLRFAQADRRDRRNGESDARHARIVGLSLVAFEQIRSRDLGVVATSESPTIRA